MCRGAYALCAEYRYTIAVPNFIYGAFVIGNITVSIGSGPFVPCLLPTDRVS